jgi:hypothetical protein
VIEVCIIKKWAVPISSESLAYWFFRLNGFLTIKNFVVHPEDGGRQRTDVDILGVRFPYRSENISKPMQDFEAFTKIKDKPFIAFTEVKQDICNLNGPWTDRAKGNMPRVLRALGALDKTEVPIASEQIYDTGVYYNDTVHISLVCIGVRVQKELQNTYCEVPQITWDRVIRFIFRRFNDYRDQKVDHSQWDAVGKCLWDLSKNCGNEAGFLRSLCESATWLKIVSN